MMMNTTDTLNLPERDRQPIIKVKTLMYPSELYVLKDHLTKMMEQLDTSNPAYVDIFSGLGMLKSGIKRAIKKMEAAGSSKAGA